VAPDLQPSRYHKENCATPWCVNSRLPVDQAGALAASMCIAHHWSMCSGEIILGAPPPCASCKDSRTPSHQSAHVLASVRARITTKILLEPVFRQYPVASFMKISNFMHPPINIITASLVGILSYQNTTMHQ
jgi:hypothetical protein